MGSCFSALKLPNLMGAGGGRERVITPWRTIEAPKEEGGVGGVVHY